jgi:NADH:ubiquinone oxidoreductase subunit 6 (subunit J)
MDWVYAIGAIMVFTIVGVYNIGVEEHKGGGGFPGWARTCLVVAFLIGVIMMGAGIMTATFKDALDHNPYKKEYLYKQLPDGTMEKYDSLYVLKR